MKKVCVVTGGTGGIGFATAKLMGEMYSVLICDISQEKVDSALYTDDALANGYL